MESQNPSQHIPFEEHGWSSRALEVLATAKSLAIPPARIGAEHLLLSLEVGDHLASRVLEGLAVSPSKDFGRRIPAALSPSVSLYHDDFDIQLRSDFPRLAYVEADVMGSLFLGTEHILLCLARIGIRGVNLDYERIRQAVLEAAKSG
jgi:hypothetical protein